MKKLIPLIILFLIIPSVTASLGDLNYDGIVDVYDLVTVGAHFGITSSNPNWNPNADSNGDGVIDTTDLIEVSTNLGNVYPQTEPCNESTPCNKTVTENNVTKWCRNVNGDGWKWIIHQGCMGSCGNMSDCEENPEGTNISCEGKVLVCTNGEWVDLPVLHVIGVRTINGKEFYNRNTGKRFIPRGNSFIRVADQFHPNQGTAITPAFFKPGLYKTQEVEMNLSEMQSSGYNIVRVQTNSIVINDPDGTGLNPEYLDNVADFLKRAKKHGLVVYIQFGYIPLNYPWTKPIDIKGINLLFLVQSAIEARKEYMADFIEGLKSRGAPTEYIFGYILFGEFHFREDLAPLNMESGIVTTATGMYDMSNVSQKDQMMEENLINFINEMRATVLEHDPTALVSLSIYPNAVVAGSDPRIVPDKIGVVLNSSDVDFIDIHLYPIYGLTIAEMAADAGIPEGTTKPILMGEFGKRMDIEPDAQQAAIDLRDWQVESCQYGLSGWLLWTWDPYEQPFIDSGDQTHRYWWSAVDSNGTIKDMLAPAVREDPCMTDPSPLPNNPPIGFLDAATCDNIWGWAVDMDTPNESISVHIYKDGTAGTGTLVTGTTADLLRQDVNDHLSIPGRHGFSLELPESLKDNQPHSIYAYGINSEGGVNALLWGSPKTVNTGLC